MPTLFKTMDGTIFRLEYRVYAPHDRDEVYQRIASTKQGLEPLLAQYKQIGRDKHRSTYYVSDADLHGFVSAVRDYNTNDPGVSVLANMLA